MASMRALYSAGKARPFAVPARSASSRKSSTCPWQESACSRLAPSGAFCASASRSRMRCPLSAHSAARFQCGQVRPAMKSPAASPMRWWFAEE